MEGIEDIEDLSVDGAAEREGQASHVRYNVPIKTFKKKKVNWNNQSEEENHEPSSEATEPSGPLEEVNLSNVIPGTESVYVKTWGCSHNNSDGEYMAGQLAAFGYNITQDPAAADLWILNSCTVKNPSEQNFTSTVDKATQSGKKVVLAGCVPQGQKTMTGLEKYSVIGVQQIDRVVDVVEETLKGHVVQLMGQKKENGKRTGGARLDLPKIRKNPLIEIIPINTGCLNHCTYCKTKHARGDLASYHPEEILARVRSVVLEGVVEIWFTSEDTGTYGRDIGTSLPELLWAVIKELPEGVMMRVGMTNPPYILEHLEEMAKILNHPRVYSFLHVPVQAGSDKVLNLMRREYTVADFSQVAEYLKSQIPGMTVATDIICGFPQETEEDFEQTLALIEKFKFPVLYISQFYARPGTPAARMEMVNRQEVKRRSREVTKLFDSYHPYDHEISSVQTVLVTDMTSDGLQYVAHNKFYEQVLISKDEDDELMGKMFKVKITSAGKFFLLATVLKESLSSVPFIPKPIPKGFLSIPPKTFEHQHVDEESSSSDNHHHGDSCGSGGCDDCGDSCCCSDPVVVVEGRSATSTSTEVSKPKDSLPPRPRTLQDHLYRWFWSLSFGRIFGWAKLWVGRWWN